MTREGGNVATLKRQTLKFAPRRSTFRLRCLRKKRPLLGTSGRFFRRHRYSICGTCGRGENKNRGYEKRLSTSRYEFQRLAFNEAPLPSQGSDSPRGVEDLDPGGGQSCNVEKPDAERRTQTLDIPTRVSAEKKRPLLGTSGRFFRRHRYSILRTLGRGKE